MIGLSQFLWNVYLVGLPFHFASLSLRVFILAEPPQKFDTTTVLIVALIAATWPIAATLEAAFIIRRALRSRRGPSCDK